MALELRSITIDCPRCRGRRPMYTVLENNQIVYCYPPVDEGEPGFVNAVSVGCAITFVSAQERLNPAACQHFVLLSNLDARFVGKPGHYLYCRVMLVNSPTGPYAPLGGFFAVTPSPCPDSVLALCQHWLGDSPVQVAAQSGDWVLPPQTS
jgi:hypothetical protein